MKSLSVIGASLLVGLSLAACATEVAGGGEESDGVLAVNLETGETETFPGEGDVPDGWAVCEDGSCPDPLACADVGEPACLSRSDCAPLYGDDGGFAGCGEGGTTCDAASCGPAPGMPSIECPDGSIGGSTGRCLESPDGTCGWEIRQCPDETCGDAECGPAPGMPATTCEDGSIGGSTGRCLRSDEGTCGWEILDCPEDGCSDEECGPQPPGLPCSDGSGTSGPCVRSADGVCGWTTRECPEETCGDEECGPPLGLPAEVCEDGSIGGNTGRCIRYEGGLCSWEIRECPEDAG